MMNQVGGSIHAPALAVNAYNGVQPAQPPMPPGSLQSSSDLAPLPPTPDGGILQESSYVQSGVEGGGPGAQQSGCCVPAACSPVQSPVRSPVQVPVQTPVQSPVQTPVQTPPTADILPQPIEVTGQLQLPEPIPFNPKNSNGTVNFNNAASLPTWPMWEQSFRQLGMSPVAIQGIASAPLDEQKLEQLHRQLLTGSTQVSGSNQPVLSNGWNEGWAQRFLALGLNPQELSKIEQRAIETQATGAELEEFYQDLSRQMSGELTNGWGDGWARRFAALGLDQNELTMIADRAIESKASGAELEEFYQLLVAQMSNKADGSNDQFVERFAAIGMPESIIAIYAQSGAPAAGMERALEHATERVNDFKERGWYDKFSKAGLEEEQIWGLILADQPISDKELAGVLNSVKRGDTSLLKKTTQALTSLAPGGHAAQYLMGKNVISGTEIDRGSKLQMGLAALSGAALLVAGRGGIRNIRSLKSGLNAHAAGYKALTQVGAATAGGSVGSAALGARLANGSTPKLTELLRSGALRRQVKAFGHAEGAAKAYLAGGQKLDPLQSRIAGQMFDGIKTGSIKVDARTLSRSPFKAGAPTRMNGDTLTFANGLRIGDGRSQLAGVVQGGGHRMGLDPAWLTGKPRIVGATSQLSSAQLNALGETAGVDVTRRLGAGADGRIAKNLNKLANKADAPEWYSKFAARAGSSSAGHSAGTAEGAVSASGAALGRVAPEVEAAAAEAASLTPAEREVVDQVLANLKR